MSRTFNKWLIAFIILGSLHANAQIKLNAEQLETLLLKDKTVQLIDVRTPGEVAGGYIKGSKNLDYSSPDFFQKISSLDKSKPVVVYCAVGGRSGKTAAKMNELGFKQIYDFVGGMTEWKAKQKPIVKT